MLHDFYKQDNLLGKVSKALAFTSWVFLGFVLAQFLVALALGAVLSLNIAGLAGMDETVLFTVVAVLVYGLAIAIVIGLPWLLTKRKTTLSEVGLNRLPSWRDIAWAPVGMVGYLILTSILMAISLAILPFVDAGEAQDIGLSDLSGQHQYVLAFISLVVLAPVAEEVLFRGYLFGKLKKFLPIWLSIIITSVLFGVVHFQWNVGIDTFALSVVMCLLRLKTGSLWPAILLHMMKNGVAFYFLFINSGLLSTLGG